ncbi:hypothetical protein [Priestia megaterium]|uniref:hypothetical protein n=1 Tax=Priestia megaterium TaxID=1404 RepID=UPI0025A45478|nr:hypothetical protein [Priestia megaterium]MDM8149976.1 hypothetical protein [Priestia megaterium]
MNEQLLKQAVKGDKESREQVLAIFMEDLKRKVEAGSEKHIKLYNAIVKAGVEDNA